MYLRLSIRADGNPSMEVSRWIAEAHGVSRWVAEAHGVFHKLESVCHYCNIHNFRKQEIYFVCVVSKLLYSLEGVVCKAVDRQRFNAFYCRCLRQMLRLIIGWTYAEEESWQERGHRMRIKLQNTIRIYDVQLWNRTALRRKWNWACRVACMSSSRWSRQTASFDPAIHMQTGQSHILKRSRGRPRL